MRSRRHPDLHIVANVRDVFAVPFSPRLLESCAAFASDCSNIRDERIARGLLRLNFDGAHRSSVYLPSDEIRRIQGSDAPQVTT